MADISKCNNSICPFKDKCYRFTAPSGMWQSYGNFRPYVNENEDLVCDYFWEVDIEELNKTDKIIFDKL